MRQELENSLLNEVMFSGSDGSDLFKQVSKDYDINNINGLSISNVVPENPRTLHHIESFNIEEEVVGTVTYLFTRKTQNERSE